MYLDRCKGLEKDTLRFMLAINDSEHIQMDWDFIKPFFIRALNFKKGKDILELFELIKGKMILNKKNSQLPDEEQKELLTSIQTDFYRKLINELLDRKAFTVADIIYTEYQTQIPQNDPNDLLGMKISCLKRDIQLFEDNLDSRINSGSNNDPTK